MRFSLNELLRTGFLGELRPGMLLSQVTEILGEPDYCEATSRRHPQPRIYVYGSVELYFDEERPQAFKWGGWDAEGKGAFSFGKRGEIIDWEFTPEMPLKAVEDYLNEHDIPFTYDDRYGKASPRLHLASGARVSFYEDKFTWVSVHI